MFKKFNTNQSLAFAEFLNNLAAACFIGGIIAPILTRTPFSFQTAINLTLSLVFTMMFLILSMYILRTDNKNQGGR